MAWSGRPLSIEDLLFKPPHGLVDQSLHSRLRAETTNGDGFGLGWYDGRDGPVLYRSISPAWADENLRELAAHVASPLFMAHVRATTGTPVQRTNCHPFRHGRWLFAHNGSVARYHELRRELMLAVDPSLFADIEGSTDSEVLFHLALTFGLDDDPVGAVERAIGFAEQTAGSVEATIGLTDGVRVWAFRYSTGHASPTLFKSSDAAAISQLHPENPTLRALRDEDRVVVSEPFAELPGAWTEIPESTVLIVQPGADEQRPLHIRAGASPPVSRPAAPPGPRL